jgi:hypothetical protein
MPAPAQVFAARFVLARSDRLIGETLLLSPRAMDAGRASS